MADTEQITILRVDTGEAVKSVGDLKQNISALKEHIEGLEIGTSEYKETLNELSKNQRALKDAMHASTASIEDVSASARGLSESYNGLVNHMAILKEEFRATNDEARRNELGTQINEINTRLKEMDALQGNFQRNVGNYTSALDGLGGILKQFPPTLGAMKEKIGKVGESMQLVGKQPILGIVGLLAPAIIKITGALQENETAMAAIHKLMESFKPVLDIVSAGVETLAGWISKLVDWFVNLGGESGGVFATIIQGAVGVGNAILQYILTPIKTAISAFKGLGNIIKDVFTGNFKAIKEDAANAWYGIKDAFSEGFSFKANFEKGKEIGAQFLEGLKNNRPAAEEKGEEIGKSVADGIKKGIDDNKEAIDNSIKELLATLRGELDTMYDNLIPWQEEVGDQLKAELEQETADVKKAMDAQVKITEDGNKKKGEAVKKVAAITQVSAQVMAGSLSSIADMMEEQGELTEDEAEKVKNIRIASAVLETISGSIAAFMGMITAVPGPIGIALGSVSAATTLAVGLANVAKMRQTDVSSGSASASASTATASVSAPSVPTDLTQVRAVTGASEEDRLNQMASSQRVYILQSDIEASNNASKVQAAETSF